MPKATTQTSTKAATKTANTKTTKPAKEEKPKRAPSAYNVFMKDKLTAFKANNPEMSHKDAFKAVASLWKEAPENPNRGQEPRSKKKSSEDKENATSKAKSSKGRAKAKEAAPPKKVVEQSEEEDAGEDGSDD